MKRLNNKFKDIVDFANLKRAAKQAQKGKRSQLEIKRFFYKLEYHLIAIQDSLSNKTYQPGNFYIFTILDPKKREISAAPFTDRIVHHALCNILEPWFEKFYIYDSYACRKGKGQHKALQRSQQFSQQYGYFFKFDIQKFFPSITTSILRKILSQKIKDKDILWLLDTILKNSPHDDGLPIGNLTSQHFANLYLNELDQFIKNTLKIKGYCRYMDDAIIFGESKKTLWYYKKEITEFLHSSLQLQINEKSSFLRPVRQGIPFLGFVVFPKLIRLQRKNWVRFCRKFKKRQKECLEGKISVEKMADSIRSLCVHIQQANTWGLRGSFLSENEWDF